jgi:hypothetical protein
MAITKADAKRRVVVSAAAPGDVFDVQAQDRGRIVLVRLEQPHSGPRMTRARCLRAIASAPLKMKASWEELRALTREP